MVIVSVLVLDAMLGVNAVLAVAQVKALEPKKLERQ